MKPTIIGLSLLTVLLLISVLSVCYVSEAVDSTIQYLDQAADTEQAAVAEGYIQKAYDYWEDRQPLFGLIMRHDELDEIACEIALLQAYAVKRDWDDFEGNYARLVTKMKQLKEMEHPKLHNIF